MSFLTSILRFSRLSVPSQASVYRSAREALFTVRYMIVQSSARQSADLDLRNPMMSTFRVLCLCHSTLDQTDQYKSQIQHFSTRKSVL